MIISKILQFIYFKFIPNLLKVKIQKSILVICHKNISGYYFFLEALGLKKYENNAQKFILNFATKGDFIDIGANYGIFSYFLSRREQRKPLFLFEPNARLSKILLNSALRNKKNKFILSVSLAAD